MSREEAVAHLGTIAKSGTAEFFKRLTGDQQKDAQLIGQFGVGFYSAFIVAERVEVLTRRADAAPEDAVRWESSADGQFTRRDHNASRARHQRGAAPEGGREGVRRPLPAARAGTPLLGPHRLSGAHAQARRRDARLRGRQSGAGNVDPAAQRDQGGGIPRFVRPYRPRWRRAVGLEPQPGRGQARVHQPALHSGDARRSTCGSARRRAD